MIFLMKMINFIKKKKKNWLDRNEHWDQFQRTQHQSRPGLVPTSYPAAFLVFSHPPNTKKKKKIKTKTFL